MKGKARKGTEWNGPDRRRGAERSKGQKRKGNGMQGKEKETGRA